MAIRTFSSQERYKRSGTEPRKKLKKVRSVKVANLDKLRLSMKRDKCRFYRGVEATTEALESSSVAISGTSSPNYMKATTSSSARKGSGSAARNETSGSSVKSTSKINKVSVQGYDPAGVNIPVKVKPERTIKRMPSLKHSKKLSSKKSMRIRARYSQFSEVDIDQADMLGFDIMGFQNDTEITGTGMENDTESLNASSSKSNDQDFMIEEGAKEKGILVRSRSRKLTRLRSLRSSRTKQRPKSRFNNGGTEVMPFEGEVSEPHYMKATTSQQARKNPAKGLTRTSSLRPLRILAKIPSLRAKRNKVKKRPQDTLLSSTSVHRPTCSSTLRKTQFSDGIDFHSGVRELGGTSSHHVCPYSYCSIHGHRHHTPQQPIKEFISAKRKLFSNQKGVKNVASATETETDQSGQKFSIESYDETHEVMSFTTENAEEDEDDRMDFLVKIYAKPRKKWATEGTLSQDADALNIAIYDQINSEQYEEKLSETLSESSGVEEKQGALNDYQQTQQQICNITAISLPCEFREIGPKSVCVSETLEPRTAELPKSLNNPFQSASRDSEAIPHDYLTKILSDTQKYTSMWQLIYQELASNEASMSEALGDIQAEEQESDVGKSCREMRNEDVKGDMAEKKKLELEQTAAIKLVQGAVNAILQHETKSNHQRSKLVNEITNSFVTDETIREGGQKDEKGINLESAEKQHKMKQIGDTLLKNEEPKVQETVGKNISKSLSKLRKMFMTAKFIKAMERLKRINPHKPQYLSLEPVLENERVYLRHLSIKDRKNTEELMLDYALRQVISRLDPEKQRRVAQLVEAFESVAPEQEEKSNRAFPMASMADAIPINGEKKQYVECNQDLSFSRDQLVERQDPGVLDLNHDVPEKEKLTEEYKYLVNKTDDEIMQESAETQISGSTLVLSEKTSKSASVNKESNDEGPVNEKPIDTLKFPPENPTEDSEVSLSNDMTGIFINKQKYTSMWNLIYQHVSSEVSVNENQGINRLDAEEQGGEANNQNINGRDSTSSSYNMDQKEDTYDKNVNNEKPDLDQSTAITLVKEALSTILKHYKQPNHSESIRDHDRVFDDASHTEGNSIDVENISLPLQPEVESCEKFKEPQRKMSKSLSKLKKAIATTRFIKAMERLMKSSPRKSQNMSSDTTLEEEKVYLRHRSMNGRKKDEEWMLDYALRQVVSKLDTDQQRRVALLVEAFETMHPEQKDTTISCPLKSEATDCNVLVTRKSDVKENKLETKQQQSTSIEKIHHKQEDDILLPTRDALPEKNLPEPDQQASSADDILVKEINKSKISDSTLESSEHESKTSMVKIEEQSVGDEETGRALKYTSLFPTGNAEVNPEGEMASILFDKQRYTSMWHLIYQQVLSNDESTGKQEANDDEEEQGDEANTCHALNDRGSTQPTQLKKSEVDEGNQSAASDQSTAIYLVKEAIQAILQFPEQRSDQQSLQDHENVGGKRVEEHRDREREKKLHIVENTSAPFQQLAKPKEATRKMPTGFSKLKRAIATAKFIKAMERLRKINPHKPRHLSAEATSEEERVYLRHLSINARKNDEEWMLDYALRKVISDLALDQQRKVARLVQAFETVNPEQKGIRNATKAEWDRAVHFESKTEKERIVESNQDSSTACDDNTPSMHSDRLNMLQTHDTLEKHVLEDQSIILSNLKMELPDKILDSKDSNLDIHHRASSKGARVSENEPTKSEETDDANPIREPIQPDEDSHKDRTAGITKGLFGDKQKNSSMWLIISQHIKSIGDVESGSTPNERLANDEPLNKNDASAEMIHDDDDDDDDDDSIDSSVATELTEKDAIKFVREAINDILDAPQGLENELTSGNKTTENPKKSLSRGYSKLRQLIICNKFIKAMEKTRKFYPQKHSILALNSESEIEKAQLKSSKVGEKKGMDEWMLDNVLQKAIAGLTPVKQRRVALLVEAFEKVNPNPEERENGPCCTKTEFSDAISLEDETKESEKTETLQNSKLPCSFDLKLEGPVAESITIRDKAVAQHKEKTSTSASKSIQKEDLEGEWNHGSQDSGSLRKSASLWGLILQRVTTDMLEKGEAPKPSIDVDAQKDSDKMLEREAYDSSQPSSKVKSCRDMGVQTPDSFDFEEDEAIKLVEEAVEEMLLVQDQLSDTESMASSTISEQDVNSQNNGDNEEPSPTATPDEEKLSTKENLPKTYSTLSKVMMCRRFVKAMDKRRKLKARSKQEVAQPSHSEESVPSLRQITTSDKKSWEEGMLDHALQKVIGNLAPAKKQRVALLVQAFESVGSQPEPTSSWKGKVPV